MRNGELYPALSAKKLLQFNMMPFVIVDFCLNGKISQR